MAYTQNVSVINGAQSLSECLFSYAIKNPSHDAIVTPTVTYSYRELTQLVKAQVARFYELGISDNSIVGIQCADEIQHLTMCMAATYIGCTSCTIPTYESEQLRDTLIGNFQSIVIVDETHAANSDNTHTNFELTAKENTSAKFLFSTSGTTGNPKLVVHYDEDIVEQAYRHVQSDQERFLCLASIEHNFAKRHRLYCIAMGATNIFLNNHEDALVEICKLLNVNVIHVSAFQAQELLALEDINNLSSVRLKLGGSHVDCALREKLRNSITRNLQAGYGTTETGAIAFTDPNDTDAKDSVGQPLPGIEVRTVSSSKEFLAKGERGEITIRSKGMFREYLNNENLTRSKLQGGWFYTGDIGYIDEEGRIYLSGRSDDMFVFNSMNIYPQDIESQILEHPSVIDVAVIPEKSVQHGNIPIALVVFDENIKPKLPALRKYVKKKVGIRSPQKFIIVNEIPRNSTGKIIRNEVVNVQSKSEDVREFIIETIGEHATKSFKKSFISSLVKGDEDVKLNKFDLDSLARMNLLVALEVNYKSIITPAEFTQFRYFGHLVARVLSQSNDIYKRITDLPTSSLVGEEKVNSSEYHIVNLIRRAFNFCPTVTHFNIILETLENRITPLEIEVLCKCQDSNQILPAVEPEKYHSALNAWLNNIVEMMLDSGKKQPEQFTFKRLSPHVRYFTGIESPTEKTLLICFTGRGVKNMSMPCAVLLQHTNSSCYDLLIISEPLNLEYRHGVPFIGNNPNEVIQWISNLDEVKRYKQIRTIGSSAGGYMAVKAGYALDAELAMGNGAIFNKMIQLNKYLGRIASILNSVNKNCKTKVLLTYAKEEKRDRHCANVISMLTGASQIIIEYKYDKIGHDIFRKLAELHNLKPYLERTIYTDMDNEIIQNQKIKKVVLKLPENKFCQHN